MVTKVAHLTDIQRGSYEIKIPLIQHPSNFFFAGHRFSGPVENNFQASLKNPHTVSSLSKMFF